jgi:hypothetical protein
MVLKILCFQTRREHTQDIAGKQNTQRRMELNMRFENIYTYVGACSPGHARVTAFGESNLSASKTNTNYRPPIQQELLLEPRP